MTGCFGSGSTTDRRRRSAAAIAEWRFIQRPPLLRWSSSPIVRPPTCACEHSGASRRASSARASATNPGPTVKWSITVSISWPWRRGSSVSRSPRAAAAHVVDLDAALTQRLSELVLAPPGRPPRPHPSSRERSFVVGGVSRSRLSFGAMHQHLAQTPTSGNAQCSLSSSPRGPTPWCCLRIDALSCPRLPLTASRDDPRARRSRPDPSLWQTNRRARFGPIDR